MSLSQCLSSLFGHADASDAHRSERLWAPAEFQCLLQRERARSDRSGEPFSVLTFTFQEGTPQTAARNRLTYDLVRRLRCTDEAGQLDDTRIGVLLPSTPAEGAWKVADGMCLGLPPRSPMPKCEVYTYPTQSWQNAESVEPLEPAENSPPGPGPVEEVSRPVQAAQRFFCRELPAWKRVIDVIVAGTALLVLLPLFAIVAAAIKLTSPGPVFFRQLRSGLAGRRFYMYKFRSMRVDAERLRQELAKLNEQDGPAFKIRNDPRVTRLGRFLRSTSIDELPQLWNVLRGEMSLVGPRPLPCHESDACAPWQLRRLDVTPGLTCIWQVRGRCRVSFDEWMRMDIQYVVSRSPVQDVKLLLQTVPAVLARHGAT